MSTVNVTVPANGSLNEKLSWARAVSATLDAGNDVVFVDENGANTNVNHINLSADGSVKLKATFEDTDDSVSVYLVKGGWHDMPIHEIYADGTDASLGIIVKLQME